MTVAWRFNDLTVDHVRRSWLTMTGGIHRVENYTSDMTRQQQEGTAHRSLSTHGTPDGDSTEVTSSPKTEKKQEKKSEVFAHLEKCQCLILF